MYDTFAVDLMGLVRLAQIAVGCWLENGDVERSLFWEGYRGVCAYNADVVLLCWRGGVGEYGDEFAAVEEVVWGEESAYLSGACSGECRCLWQSIPRLRAVT